MKLEIGPVRSTYVAPTFGADDRLPLDPRLQHRLRRPMLVGGAIIATLVIGLMVWASVTPLASGISAPGQVTVEANRKTIRHKETGTVRQIFVKEGQLVHAGQPLITFDDTDNKAAVSILQNQADTLMSQTARLSAEATNRPALQFPAELTSRAADPTVAGMIRDQDFLFTSRLQLYQSQASILQQRLDQIQNQIVGDQAQLDSTEEQRKLTIEEMSGYETLYAKGYAPKTLILRYQRQVSDLAGKKGSLLADIARLHQQMGETKMNLAALRDKRQSDAAEQLRDTQSKLEEVMPKLVAAQEAEKGSVVTSPVDGYVFNLTQFTPGGVAGGGENLMDIVPSNSPLMVTVMIKPEDIDQVHVGMKAQVRLVGPNPRWNTPLPATVAVVSADRITSKESGASFFRADLRIDPKDMKGLEKNVKVQPGMTAAAMIVTGNRTLMGFLIQPIVDTVNHSFHEQ
ncbi:HlyD family type I secretion periplasmic adaptor subunit [Phenylobacterium sp.]|uniref:HlyD family type I secretion periplasmic adaptor subunit n=1 Tax=Phenylobacterium sp. TaxID=1871053 RepID=UPI002DE34BBF|nr:HlyD family type I secretion periplasmic adaptor subunit [Phenylobacterium sp.]